MVNPPSNQTTALRVVVRAYRVGSQSDVGLAGHCERLQIGEASLHFELFDEVGSAFIED